MNLHPHLLTTENPMHWNPETEKWEPQYMTLDALSTATPADYSFIQHDYLMPKSLRLKRGMPGKRVVSASEKKKRRARNKQARKSKHRNKR